MLRFQKDRLDSFAFPYGQVFEVSSVRLCIDRGKPLLLLFAPSDVYDDLDQPGTSWNGNECWQERPHQELRACMRTIAYKTSKANNYITNLYKTN